MIAHSLIFELVAYHVTSVRSHTYGNEKRKIAWDSTQSYIIRHLLSDGMGFLWVINLIKLDIS